MASSFGKKLFQRQNICHRATLATAAISGLELPSHLPDLAPEVIVRMSVPSIAPCKRLRQRHQLPASLMRAGTSRGLFIHAKNLPAAQDEWKPWILAAMGSKNSDARQIDGVGGATSTTSKVCIVAPSERPGIDVEYTFVQVAVGKESLDFSGNCGNMASGIGPFAVEEGLVKAQRGQTHLDVSIYNTNTKKRIVETVELDDEGHYYEEGEFSMPGVKTPGSEVKVAFVDPAGSMTGKLFPTGCRSEPLAITQPRNGVSPFVVQASMVDAANPFVLVDKTTMPLDVAAGSDAYLELLEDVRRAGAVQMGLATDIDSASRVRGTPKLAFVSPAGPDLMETLAADVFVAAMSMQKPHPSLQLTGAVCIGAAACIPGTIVHAAMAQSQYPSGALTPYESDSQGSESEHGSSASIDIEYGGTELIGTSKRTVRLAHASGQINVDVKLHTQADGGVTVESCSVSRTARKIFDGNVLVNLEHRWQ